MKHHSGKRTLWLARVLAALAVLFLLFDSIIKLVRIPPVVESFARLGFSPDLARTIGALELICVLLYVMPSTSVLGAILMTGFLGGATAAHVRVGDPLPTHALFAAYVGTMLWVSLWLRDVRLRTVVPVRHET